MQIEANINTYRKKLGKAVFDARKKLKCSRCDLAEEIGGISYKTIERIEKANYTNDLTLSKIQKVSSFLGISIKLTLGSS